MNFERYKAGTSHIAVFNDGAVYYYDPRQAMPSCNECERHFVYLDRY